MAGFGSDHDNTTKSSINLASKGDLVEEPKAFTGDAGIRAAERIRERSLKAKAAKAFFVLMSGLAVLLITGVSGVGYYGYATMTTGLVTNERPCSLEVGKRTVTGVREYVQRYNEIFGYQFIKTNDVVEKTTINVRGVAFVVVGHLASVNEKTGKNWWSKRIGMGEQGVQILDRAESYTFVFEDAVQVVPYRGLCR
jgi:hypothetical protein